MKEPLDSWQLRVFATLAGKGSFTQAARELHLTQSAISHSVKALERSAGCRLLDRLGKKVVLTLAGEQLLQHAEKILREMESARASLEQLGRWGKGRLRLGATTTSCQHIIPPVLREFKESFPDHLISIDPGDTPELMELLLLRRIDLALCVDPPQEPQLEFHRLFTDELKFIVGPMHPWAQAGRVTQAEIPRQRYILYSKNSVTFRLVEAYFAQDDLVLNTVMELGDIQACKELVKLGLGVSIIAPWVAQKELSEGSLVAFPLGRRKLTRTWGLLHWHGKRLSLAEETFLSLCRSATEGLVS
jgi:LysR family transcriptional regulator, low CO2-responsive transcriptional regulator